MEVPSVIAAILLLTPPDMAFIHENISKQSGYSGISELHKTKSFYSPIYSNRIYLFEYVLY